MALSDYLEYYARKQDVTELQAAVPIEKDEEGKAKSVVSQDMLDDRTRSIIGQQTLPPRTGWNMANNRSARRLDVLGADLTNPRIRTKRVPTPAMLLGANPVASVVWDTPYADNNYTISATLQSTSTSLLGVVPTITAQSPTGCTITLKVSVVLGVGAGILHVQALHD